MSNIEKITDFVYNGRRVTLKTSNLDEYIKWLYLQTAGMDYWDSLTSRQETKKFINYLSKSRLLNWYKFIPDPEINFSDMKKIIDVGSGVAQIDLLLSQFLQNTDFYLLDKNTFDQKQGCRFHSKSMDDYDYHGFYNSFDIVKDVIQHSPIDPDRIHFLDPSDEWPDQVDLIMSSFSWMWHYSKNIYWSRLLKSLKVGGYLSTTISLRDGESTIKEISEDLGSYPCLHYPLLHTENSSDKQIKEFDKIIHTGFFVWQRMR